MTILLDTGVFYGFFDSKDPHYVDSTAILINCLEGKFGQPYTSDYVVLETTLLTQRKLGGEVPLSFLDFLRESKIRIITIGIEYYEKTLELFREKFPRLSIADAASITIINDLGIPLLASYDIRSFQGLVKEIQGVNYFQSLSREEQSLVKKKMKTN